MGQKGGHQGWGQVPVLVLVLVLDPKYFVKIKYFSSTVEPLVCIYFLTIQIN